MNEIQPDGPDGVIELTISKLILASSTSAFFYYCATHLDDEVRTNACSCFLKLGHCYSPNDDCGLGGIYMGKNSVLVHEK
ncbi:hypothetical protein PNOK_0920100 [Pyrrhoderma noxium]|uniref:Uncharacterized protein n=1 Tax=Pyrrhoderma noxium TaxID=2282107 RepID=A0A286U796_9AGAM|nr:hypothetical protein PNOK_0920100 [Pyrrhoderma noxium]